MAASIYSETLLSSLLSFKFVSKSTVYFSKSIKWSFLLALIRTSQYTPGSKGKDPVYDFARDSYNSSTIKHDTCQRLLVDMFCQYKLVSININMMLATRYGQLSFVKEIPFIQFQFAVLFCLLTTALYSSLIYFNPLNFTTQMVFSSTVHFNVWRTWSKTQ